MSRLHRRILATCCLALGAGSMLVAPAQAASHASGGRNGIDVVQVNGLLDPSNASLIRDSIDDANRRHSTLLVLQVDSSGALDVSVDDLDDAIARSRVPIAVWVGPSGGKAKGLSAGLLQTASVASVSNGSTIGPINPVLLDDPSAVYPERGRRSGAQQRPVDYPTDRRLRLGMSATRSKSVGASAAERAGAVDRVDAIVGELIVGLNGKTVATAAGPVTLSTAKVVGTGTRSRLQPNQVVRFRRLGLDGQALHTLVSPSIAYLLLVVGLCLIVFEFFTASIGIAGLVGAVSVVGAFLGFSHLPVQWWAAGLLAVGIFGFAVDVQAGGLGPWTFIGGASLVAGSIWLYGGSSRLDLRWWILVVVIGSTIVFMLGGMTAMIRSRFSTPTIGREGMVGEMGKAEVDVSPDGVVRIRESLWRARTNRATPIRAGDPVRVIAVEGLVLEVEPEEGAAKDYRR